MTDPGPCIDLPADDLVARLRNTPPFSKNDCNQAAQAIHNYRITAKRYLEDVTNLRAQLAAAETNAEHGWLAAGATQDKLDATETKLASARKALEASDDVVREFANTFNMETEEGRRISIELAKIIAANDAILHSLSNTTGEK